MPNLTDYLAQHFVDAERFAALCRSTRGEVSELIRTGLVPAPSYVVGDSHVGSYVFGRMQAPGSINGEYFHPANVVWVNEARNLVANHGWQAAPEKMRERFSDNLARALRDLNDSTWRMHDSFADDGSTLEQGLKARIESIWDHFLHGTFGLCVRNPNSELAIARKEVLQEKLSALSDNGTKRVFSQEEIGTVLEVIQQYSQAAMPFSPIEYSISSRKRLVDDLLARIEGRPIATDQERLWSSTSILCHQ